MQKAVSAAAILLGAESLDEAADVAGRVPDLSGKPTGDLRGWARWLYDLYPEVEGGHLGVVQPDLLAEYHAATQLAADPGLAHSVLFSLSREQAERALTILARAWELHEDAGQLIASALRADLAELAIPAAAVAVQTRASIGDLLAAVLVDAPVQLEDLIRIEEALPYPSVTLARADLAAAERIRRELPTDARPKDNARWAAQVGLLLDQVGRTAEALDLEQEAVSIFRKLAEEMPDVYRPDLARSLNSLGNCFGALWLTHEALRVTQEAVGIYRELAKEQPDQYRHRLATSLTNLGNRFGQLGEPHEAFPFTQEAVGIHRELAKEQPELYLLSLAHSLRNLGNMYLALDRAEKALPAAQEAVLIYRVLAEEMPDQYRPDLAGSLLPVGIAFSFLGREPEALAATLEQVEIYRELAEEMPDRYRPALAESLSTLQDRFAALGRSTEATIARNEADEIRSTSQ